MSVRLKDIAERLGISVSTVSLALREAPQIAEETRVRVREAAAHLGYIHRPRQSIHTELTSVAFITPAEPGNVFYAAVLTGAEGACRAHKIALHYMRLDDSSVLRLARYRDADGFLLVSSIDEQTVERIRDVGRPVVLVDNNLPHLGLDRVVIENTPSLYRTVMELAEWGHQRIAYLGGPVAHPSFRERLLGYRLAIADLGLERIELACDAISREAVEQVIADALAGGGPQFTALLVCNDMNAIAAMHALQDRGVRVPEDVSVVGFDDIDMAQVVRPALTTHHVYREMLGTLGVHRLIERAAHPDAPAVSLALDTVFIERDSARPLR